MVESRFEAANSQPAPSEPLSGLQAERIADMFGAGNKTSRRPGDNRLIAAADQSGEENPFAEFQNQMNQQIGDLRKLLNAGIPTQSEKTFLDASKTLEAGGDPKAALAKAEPQFKQAIKEADEALAAVETKASSMPEADRQRALEQDDESQVLKEAMGKELLALSLPEKDKAKLTEDQQREELPKLRDKVEAEAEAFMKTQPGDYAFRGLQADLQQFPNIYRLASQMKTLEDSEPYKTMKGLETQFGRAMADSVLSRVTYGEALGSAGRENDAYQQMREALGKLGVKLPKNLPGTLDASI